MSPDNERAHPATNEVGSESDHTGSGTEANDTAARDAHDELGRSVVGCILNSGTAVQGDAIHRLPMFADPTLEWVRLALVAAVEQHKPLVPASIVASADRARIVTPPALLKDRRGILHDLVAMRPAPAFLPGLLDDLAESAFRLQIKAYGRRLWADSDRGFLQEQLALLELAGPLVDRCKRLMAASR